MATAAVTEVVEYSPLPGEGPLTMERAPGAGFPRSASMESTEGRFMPNIVSAKSPATDSSSPEKSPTIIGRPGAVLEGMGSYSEIPPPSMGMARVMEQARHTSCSPEYSPLTERKHRSVKACHSVPNMSGGQLRVADYEDDQDQDDVSGLSVDVMSVNAAVGSLHSSQCNLAEPGPVEEDSNSRLNKSSQRRVSRSEKRYYTADSIQELRHKDKDSSIHKRLSWQNENHLDEKLRKKVLSTDSVHSIRSSSGVSSTGSLHLHQESDITEEAEMQRSGSSRTLQEDGSPKSDGSPSSKSSPDIAMLFGSLRTGEPEDGISSVDLPAIMDIDRQGKRLTHAQILKMKKQLLLNTDVEAS